VQIRISANATLRRNHIHDNEAGTLEIAQQRFYDANGSNSS
jgi:hypothetical protein